MLRAVNALMRYVERLAAGVKLHSPEQFRSEGNGLWAIKGHSLRAYGWFSGQDTFVISHFIEKKRPELDSRDVARYETNKRAYEESNNG